MFAEPEPVCVPFVLSLRKVNPGVRSVLEDSTKNCNPLSAIAVGAHKDVATHCLESGRGSLRELGNKHFQQFYHRAPQSLKTHNFCFNTKESSSHRNSLLFPFLLETRSSTFTEQQKQAVAIGLLGCVVKQALRLQHTEIELKRERE